jgi:hypothetical protein
MFFRRVKEHVPTFSERIDHARVAGFEAMPGPQGMTRLSRGGFCADVREDAEGKPEIADMGLQAGGEMAELVELGFQKVWRTASGKQYAATADHLKGLYNFGEDLREALGLISLYNEGLGTVNAKHLYDRVVDRDARRARKPWEVALRN